MKKIFCICAAAMALTLGAAAARAETLDTQEVTELRVATTDCAFAGQPMGETLEEVKAGDTLYVIRAVQTGGYVGMTEYVLCNTENGLRWLWGGFTGYEAKDGVGPLGDKVNAVGRQGESPQGERGRAGAEGPLGDKVNATEGGVFTVTTYCPCAVCNSGFSGTATGTEITPGRTIAVDPSVIPLGTHVYIDGVGWRVAEDTGGAIKGNIIDLAVAGHGEFDKFSARVWW